MQVWGVSEADIRAAVGEARLVVFNDYGYPRWSGIGKKGRSLTVRLGVDRTQPRDPEGLLPFQKRGHRGRRLPYVTWEGHREFMRILFRDHPDARVKSAVADYKGRAEFWRLHPSTKGRWPQGYHGMH